MPSPAQLLALRERVLPIDRGSEVSGRVDWSPPSQTVRGRYETEPYPASVLYTAVETAADAYPGRTIRVEGEGQLSVAVRVGEELLLRFPRHALGVEYLRLEVRLLRRIRPHVDIAVPEALEIALDRPVGRAYVAHRYLPGEVVRRATVDQWPQERTRDVGAQVGVFLRQLHSLAAVAREVGVRREAPASWDRLQLGSAGAR